MTLTIKLKPRKKGTPGLEFNYPLGKNLTDLRTTLDDDTIYAAAVATIRQQLADHIRRVLGKKKGAPTPEALQESLDAGEWTPGARRRGKSAADKIAKLAASLTDADRAKLLTALSGTGPSKDYPLPGTPAFSLADDRRKPSSDDAKPFNPDDPEAS